MWGKNAYDIGHDLQVVGDQLKVAKLLDSKILATSTNIKLV